MEEREDGMTLGEIFSLMFKKKLIVLITTCVVAIIGIITILAVYNPMQKKVTAEYYYDKTTLTTGNYSDGEPFRMSDVISYDNIKAVIDSNDAYKGLNAQKIFESFTIENVQELDAEKNVKSYYKITALRKLLKNDELAKKFMNDLISYPIKVNTEIMKDVDLTKQLVKYKDSKTYADAFGYLKTAYDEIVKEYNDIITTYGDIKISVNNGENIDVSTRLVNIEFYIKNQNLNTLYNTENGTGLITDYGLILNYDFSRQSIQNELNEINNQLYVVDEQLSSIDEQYNAIYEAIKDKQVLSADAQSVIQKKSELSAQKIQLENQKQKIELKLENENATYVYYGDGGVKSQKQYEDLVALWDSTPESERKGTDPRIRFNNKQDIKIQQSEIKTKLDDVYNYLNNEFATLKDLKLQINNDATYVYYQNNSIIKTTGGLNTIIAIVLPIIAGLVIGCIVSFALSYSDFKKEKEEKFAKAIETQTKE